MASVASPGKEGSASLGATTTQGAEVSAAASRGYAACAATSGEAAAGTIISGDTAASTATSGGSAASAATSEDVFMAQIHHKVTPHGKRCRQRNQYRDKSARVSRFGNTRCAC